MYEQNDLVSRHKLNLFRKVCCRTYHFMFHWKSKRLEAVLTQLLKNMLSNHFSVISQCDGDGDGDGKCSTFLKVRDWSFYSEMGPWPFEFCIKFETSRFFREKRVFL